MDFSGDVADFLADFGVPVSWNNTTITAIFKDEFHEVLLEGIGVESADPQLICSSADVAAAAQGQTATVGGVAYYIRGVHPDGTGITILILSRD